MVGLSWPLWIDGDAFPKIPFVPGWRGLPVGLSWVVLAALTIGLGASTLERAGRWPMAVSLGLVAIEVLGDQNRLQPWVYQYLLVGLAFVVLPGGEAFRVARLFAISLYVFSGLSKLDASFVRELGPTFLSAGLAPLGFAPSTWPEPARTAAILAMPASEMALGIGLALGPTRRLAMIGVVALHATLIAILGPWNLGHSPNVLVWNGAMIVEALTLFGGTSPTAWEAKPLGRPARMFVAYFLLYPVGERFGLSDSWPSHALYASHCERVELFLHERDLDKYPETIRRRVSATKESPWRRLDLTGWSRDVRGTPLYPQGRVGIGLAEALADDLAGPRRVRVLLWSRADPWEGGRALVECLGLPAIRRRGDRFWVNAHPARPGPG